MQTSKCYVECHAKTKPELESNLALKLTPAFVRTVKPNSGTRTYGDGRGGYGLTLVVQPNGFKRWYQRLRIKDRPTNIGLGGYPLVTLAEARTLALENARMAHAGEDPRKTRQRDIPTVAETMESVIERDSPTWRDAARTTREWRNGLNRHAARIMTLRVDAVTSADCIAVLREMWQAKRETAVKLKHRLSAIFNLAIAEGYRTDNPLDVVSAALPKRRGDAQRSRPQAALPYQEVANALAIVCDTTPGPAPSSRSASWCSLPRAAERCVAQPGRRSI